MKTVVIVGAGFSKNSSLPLQAEIPALITNYHKNNEFEKALSCVIERFMNEVFGYSSDKTYPNLDDMLTCIDICTRTAHHMGIHYPYTRLGVIRKFIVYRVVTILEQSYKYSEEVKELIGILSNKYEELSYVVLNWDTVLEKYIYMLNPGICIDYCNNGKFKKPLGFISGDKCKLIKVHGSINWLYCNNCRTLINDMFNDINVVQKAGFNKMDFEMFDEFYGINNINEIIGKEKCNMCEDFISSHIASCSYRKSFRENSYPDIWSVAEDVLSNADKWIFIGYSMPQADYEFKHLLKISEMKFRHKRERKPDIDAVILKSNSTRQKYESFFGNSINRICNGGIAEYLDLI